MKKKSKDVESNPMKEKKKEVQKEGNTKMERIRRFLFFFYKEN